MQDKTAKGASLTLFASPEWRSRLPWPVLTTLGASVAALVGWLIVLAYAFLGWMEVPEVPLGQPLGFAARIWLLAHGASIRLAGGVLSIPPLGLSLLLLIVVSGVAGWIGSQVQLTSASSRGSWLMRIAGLFTIEYAIIVTAVASSLLGSKAIGPVFLGATLIGASSFVSVSRATGISIHDELVSRLPAWASAVPKAIGAGILLLVGSGALALTSALIIHWDRISFLQESLGAGTLGTFLLLIGQLAYLPNLILWSTGWITGAGVALGTDTIMSPVANQVGLLPTIPLFGIVPETGAAPWYHLVWLVVPMAVGVAAAWLVLTRLARQVESYPRADFTALVGGLVSLTVGVLVSLLALLSGGDMGEIRLIDLGVRWPAMIIIAPTLLGFAGLFTGLVMGLRAPGLAASSASKIVPEKPELTGEQNTESESDELDDERFEGETSEADGDPVMVSEASDDPVEELEGPSDETLAVVVELPVQDDEVPSGESEIPELEETVALDTGVDSGSTPEPDSEEPVAQEDEVENTEDVIAKLVESVENAYRRDAGLDEISRP